MKIENNFMFNMRQRSNHYQRKLISIDKYIHTLNTERINIDSIRMKYTTSMRLKERLMMEYKLELEKLTHYKADVIYNYNI